MTESSRIAERRAHVADAITRFSGSFEFIGLHIVWFGLWIALNLIPATTFDAFPFGLLTLIVSLEAIFVLISQNRGADLDVKRHKDNLRVSVVTEVWVEQIGDKLGIDRRHIQDTADARLRQHDDA